MKKLSEVCRLVGVTRRTLQEYDKVDLVKPTSKTEGGYWLYDDAAIQKLILIQIFVEAGYERKPIKTILESPALDMFAELDRLIDTLEAKRKRIDGMINTIKILKLTAKLPKSTLQAVGGLDVTRMYQNKSFDSYLEEAILHTAEYSETDRTEAEIYIPFWYNLIAIGSHLGKPMDSALVQHAVGEAYSCMEEIALADEDDSAEKPTETELIESFAEGIQEMMSDLELRQMVDIQCGDGAAEYIVRAVQLFSSKRGYSSTIS